MPYDKVQISGKLLRWERFLQQFNLPQWEELPQIELYMDQVIVLLTDYLGFFVYEGNDEKLITAAMVNNYVKLKLVPAPVKKKYGRAHLACLIMICTFKQTQSMAVVKKMLPTGDEESIKRDYNQFVGVHKRLALYFTEQVKTSAADIFDESSHTGNEVSDLVMGAAVAASFAKLLTGKIIALQLHSAGEKEKETKESKEKAAPGDRP